jgi:hypothetical protein
MPQWLRNLLVIAFAVLIALATLFFLPDATGEQTKVQTACMDPTERERIREIVLSGIDDGLKAQIQHLFEIWTKDVSADQPKRAMVGTNNAFRAHVRARRQAIAWDPPICER